MKSMRIPFCPLPVDKAKGISKIFYGFTRPFEKSKLQYELKVAEMNLTAREYMSIVFFTSLFNSLFAFLVLFIVSIRFVSLASGFFISSLFTFLIFFMVFMYLKIYPKIHVKKKVIDLEKNLLFSVRHMYVMIQSGVSIFNAIASVANSNYGNTSKEFKKIVSEVNSGKSLEDALEEASVNNPSPFFRRVIWQIVNGIKSGSNVSSVMESTVDYLANEQKIAIRRYGSQLNPLTLMFMMFAVIIPTMGITFLIVLSTLSGFNITENLLIMLLVFIIIFQFMFLGLMKSKRPGII